MTDRILRAEQIINDKAVNQLCDGEFRLLIHLTVTCDAYGRQVADPVMIKATAFPRSERATTDIERDLNGLREAGLLVIYTKDGEQYLQLTPWQQRKRSGVSRFPGPGDPDVEIVAPRRAAQSGAAPRRAARQEETPPNPRRRSDLIPDISCLSFGYTGNTATPIPSSPYNPPAPLPPPAFELPLNDGTLWPVTDDMIDGWERLYPAVDVRQELRNMIGWLGASPKNRKTRNGVQRFVINWLSREQNRAPARQVQRRSPLDVIRAEREAST